MEVVFLMWPFQLPLSGFSGRRLAVIDAAFAPPRGRQALTSAPRQPEAPRRVRAQIYARTHAPIFISPAHGALWCALRHFIRAGLQRLVTVFSFPENALASASAKKNDLKANSCKKNKQTSKSRQCSSAPPLFLNHRNTRSGAEFIISIFDVFYA